MIYYFINSIYEASKLIADQIQMEVSPQGYLYLLGIQLLSTLALFVVFYTFRSIGLYQMAKKKGVEKPWLAIVPFFALYIAQKLQPQSKYVKVYKYLYVFAIIAKIASLACVIVTDCLYAYNPLVNLFNGKLPLKTDLMEYNPAASVLQSVYSITDIAYAVLALMIYVNVFRAYSLKRASMFSWLSALCYFLIGNLIIAGIFIFVLRKNERVDYDSIIDEKRRQQQAYQNTNYGGNPYGRPPYGGNGYGNPYGRPPFGGNGYGNPYGQNRENANNNGNNANNNAPDPFEEFSSKSNNTSDGADDNGTDDLFN